MSFWPDGSRLPADGHHTLRAQLRLLVVGLRVAEPMIDFRLFRHRGVWTAQVAALMYGTTGRIAAFTRFSALLRAGDGAAQVQHRSQ